MRIQRLVVHIKFGGAAFGGATEVLRTVHALCVHAALLSDAVCDVAFEETDT